MTLLPRARRFDWNNLGIRTVSGAVLASGAVWATLSFPLHGRPGLEGAPFLLLIAVAGALLSLEWAEMVARPRAAWTATATCTAVVAVILLAYQGYFLAAWIAVAAGAAAVGLMARGAAARALDAAYGVLYIAPVGLVILWLIQTRQGPGWTLMLFATTWAADIAAFAVGSALKGPKLWPRFSPNKTWSGFVGGLVGAIGVAVGVAYGFMRLSLAAAAIIGLAGGLATMAGDLWESMLKRRFGVKDSGDLIPGHGGLLDRVDGLMFAVMVFAVARLIDSLGWSH
jgi:phosphatidate cytidylyltransferase